MKEYYVTWNERIFYESRFETDAEEGSYEWYDAMFTAMSPYDSFGIDDMEVEEPYTL